MAHTALITGAARGIGKGYARAILEAGGKVALIDIQEDTGKATEAEFQTEFGAGSVLFLLCDVANKVQLEDAFKKTIAAFGYIDLVVNNAAIFDEENWRKCIEINLVAVIQGSKIAIDYMSTQNGGHGGHIINTASVAGLGPYAICPVYSATKHGVIGFSRSIAEAHASDSIRFNCLCPFAVDTPLFSEARKRTPVLQSMEAMEVSVVVAAFQQLLADPTLTGSVWTVSREETKRVF